MIFDNSVRFLKVKNTKKGCHFIQNGIPFYLHPFVKGKGGLDKKGLSFS